MTEAAARRTILITGCSSGIGHEAALTLSRRGWRVFASARKREDVEALRRAGLEALWLDLADSRSIEAAARTVLEKCGGQLDALFNNGAYGQPGAVEDLPMAALRAQFETNVFGAHHLTRLILPAMRAKGAGRIVQNSSILGFIALKYRGAYVASKYALEGLTDALRLELAGTGIHVVLLQPGPIATRFRANAQEAFLRHIDQEASPHREAYHKQVTKRLAGAATPFTLPPEAVVKALIHALEAPRPKLRYRITVPTKLFWLLKRLLSGRALDGILGRVG